jgi:hypothetical protein
MADVVAGRFRVGSIVLLGGSVTIQASFFSEASKERSSKPVLTKDA